MAGVSCTVLYPRYGERRGWGLPRESRWSAAVAAAVEGSWRLQFQRGGRTAGQHWRAAGSQSQSFHLAVVAVVGSQRESPLQLDWYRTAGWASMSDWEDESWPQGVAPHPS